MLVVVVLFFALVFVFASKLFQKADTVGEESAHIENIKLCTFVPSSGECSSDTVSFDPDTGDVYATANMKNIEVSVLKAKWIYILDGEESVLAEDEVEIFEDGFVQLQLEKSPTRGWLEGNYRLDLSLRDKTGTTVVKEFTITSQ